MARNVVVRRADPEEFGALDRLWAELAGVGPGPLAAGERARARWERSWHDSDATYVAWVADEPVGLVAMAAQDSGAWTGRVLVVTVMHVSSTAQRKGVGYALLEAVADFALSAGVDSIAVDVPPSMREANRFFARLGFAPIVTRRVTPSAALKRRLDSQPGGRMARLRARSATRRAARPVG